jgi:hypothetical protein
VLAMQSHHYIVLTLPGYSKEVYQVSYPLTNLMPVSDFVIA